MRTREKTSGGCGAAKAEKHGRVVIVSRGWGGRSIPQLKEDVQVPKWDGQSLLLLHELQSLALSLDSR